MRYAQRYSTPTDREDAAFDNSRAMVGRVLVLGDGLQPQRPAKRPRPANGSDIDPALIPQATPGSLLARLHALEPSRAHALEDDAERTVLRAGEPDESLTWDGLSAVWSVGAAVRRSFTFDHHAPIDQCLFAHFAPLPSAVAASTDRKGKARDPALYGVFAPAEPPPWPASAESAAPRASRPSAAQLRASSEPRRAIVILLQDLIYIHFVGSGTDHHIHLPFVLRRRGAWTLEPTGIVLERAPDAEDRTTVSSGGPVPTLYSLSDPLDELRIVAVADSAVARPMPLRDAVLAGQCAHRPFAALEETIVAIDPTAPSSSHMAVSLDTARGKLAIWRYVVVPDREQEQHHARRLREQDVLEARRALAASNAKRRPRDMSAVEALAAGNSTSGGVAAELGQFGIDAAHTAGTNGSATPRRTVSGGSARDASRRVSLARGALGAGGAAAEMDREASLLGPGVHGGSTIDGIGETPITAVMRSEVFAEVMHEIVLPPGPPESLRDLRVEFFDRRGSAVIVAVLIPRRQSLYLYQLDTTSGALTPSPSTIAASHAMPIVATRHTGPTDLLVLSPTGDMQLLTADAVPFGLAPVVGLKGRITALARPVGSTVDLVLASGQTRRVCVDQSPRDPLVRRMLEVLAVALPSSSYLAILDAAGGKPTLSALSEAISGVVDASIGAPAAAEPRSLSAWEALQLAHRQRADRAFVRYEKRAMIPRASEPSRSQRWPRVSVEDVQAILLGLQILAETDSIVAARHDDGFRLRPLLVRIAKRVGFADWIDYYARQGFCVPADVASGAFCPSPMR